MGWGSLPKQEKKGKSLLELQREELEGRLTEENLRRLEIGKKPAKSPLLDRLNQAIESGQSWQRDNSFFFIFNKLL